MFVSNFFKFRNFMNNMSFGAVAGSYDSITESTGAKSTSNTDIVVSCKTYLTNSIANNGSFRLANVVSQYSKLIYLPAIKLSTTNTTNFSDYEIDNIASDVVISNLIYNSTIDNDKTIITINCTITNNGSDIDVLKAGIYSSVLYYNTFSSTTNGNDNPAFQQMLIAEHVFDEPVTLVANESKSLTIQLVLAS